MLMMMTVLWLLSFSLRILALLLVLLFLVWLDLSPAAKRSVTIPRFNLDDLAGTAGAVLGTSDTLFQRGLCWNYDTWRHIYLYICIMYMHIHTYMHICIYVGICICHVCSVSLACSEGSEVGNKMAGRIQVELRRRQKLRTANLQEDNDTSDWS